MISNLSSKEKAINYPLLDTETSFSEYIKKCRLLIEERRTDLNHPTRDLIIEANCPFELYPHESFHNEKLNKSIHFSQKPYKYGVLLVHGLLDCPFSLKDIGMKLQEKGMLCRALLLPGHGTKPEDLLHVTYQNWIQSVAYGIESLRQDAEHIFIAGYSTGAALAVYQALHDKQIAGIILIAPAIKIKAPADMITFFQYFLKYFRNDKRQWLIREDEIDYAKYQSIAFNPVNQVTHLTTKIKELGYHQLLSCPLFMILSREDETISSHTAIDFFSSLPHPKSKLLLYSSNDHRYPDSRILTRKTLYPNLAINHFSHVSLPFAPNNSHYGQFGDYAFASHIDKKNSIYGAYNRIEVDVYDSLFRLGLIQNKRYGLTYNPDFQFTMEEIEKFILNVI